MKTYKTIQPLLIAFTLAMSTASLLQAQRQAPELTPEQEYLAAMHKNITSAKLYDYVVQLSDTALQGRLAGSAGMEKANQIVEGYFSEWGLMPAGTNGYRQTYPHPFAEVHPDCDMEIFFPVQGTNKKTAWLSKSYPWADGWFAGNYSGTGDITGDVVYCGFGVTAPELNYDDYKGVDVKGKIVLIEGETPNRSQHPDSVAMWYKHTLHQTKYQNAIDHGAIGMLYKWVPGPNALYDPEFVYCHITDSVMNDLFTGTGKTYAETVKGIYQSFKPASFDTGKRARIKMTTTYHPDGKGNNLLAVIPGSDPELAGEYVIISAHLDHLGMIPYHIAGANDNNASSAALLGVAEALAKSNVKPKRSILFMSVDGEEAGLTGSTYYTQNPVVPQDKVVAVLNLEQVGGGEMLGASYHYAYPELGKAAEAANDAYVHRRLFTRENHFRTRPRTDGAVFMKAGYPCIDLRAAGGGYYHHPKDDVESINPEILQSATEWLYWTAINLANQ